MHWIAIYPVDSIILPIKLFNLGQLWLTNGHLSTTAIHFTLIETSLQWPPLYNGQIILHQDGRCGEVQLYKFVSDIFVLGFLKTIKIQSYFQ